MERRQAINDRVRKRKADSTDSNERLSKVSRRLSQLNLELKSQKLELPAENPSKPPSSTAPTQSHRDDDVMQIDDSKHKVYIYNLDDELSDSDSSVDENRLIFLPDIEKHLRLQSRIPPSVLANPEGELAGRNLHNELVLYNIPSSLSLPEGKDNVRKAIIETRARAREKQRREQERARTAPMDLIDMMNGTSEQRPPFVRMDASDGITATVGGAGITGLDTVDNDDPDAMDLG